MDEAKFPDMKAMTDVAHSLNLTAGWYGNNCDCKDHCSDVECFAGDVNATLAFGFVSAAALLVQQPNSRHRCSPHQHSPSRPGFHQA